MIWPHHPERELSAEAGGDVKFWADAGEHYIPKHAAPDPKSWRRSANWHWRAKR